MDLNKFNHAQFLKTPMTEYIHEMFLNAFSKKWYDTYWLIDLHGTLIKSTYNKNDNSIEYYPYAKKALQEISKREDVIKIIWSSSTDEQLNEYFNKLKDDEIYFQHINSNPNISSRNGHFGSYDKKMYFNIVIEDKAAFKPEREWYYIYELFKEYERLNIKPDISWK